MSYEAKKIKSYYSVEFKESSAKLAVESKCSISQTARDLGVKESTLHNWVSKYGNNSRKAVKSDSDQELHRLRRENTKLKQQCEILKKAAAYFASEA